MMEEWREVKEFPLYQVSNLGNVRSVDHTDSLGRLQKGKILKQCFDGRGHYLHVQLSDGHKAFPRNVHRLVAIAFLDNPNNLPAVNHIDEDKTNNLVSNLEWCTYKYNNNYGKMKDLRRGENNAMNKFTKEAVAFIKKNHVVCGGSMRNKELAEMFNMSETHVCAIAHGRRWKDGFAN